MITYGKLRRYLAENDISRKQLTQMTGLSLNQINSFFYDRNVSMGSIGKICSALNLQPQDIMERLKEN